MNNTHLCHSHYLNFLQEKTSFLGGSFSARRQNCSRDKKQKEAERILCYELTLLKVGFQAKSLHLDQQPGKTIFEQTTVWEISLENIMLLLTVTLMVLSSVFLCSPTKHSNSQNEWNAVDIKNCMTSNKKQRFYHWAKNLHTQ